MTKVFVRIGKWRDQTIEKMEFDMVSPDIMVGRNGLYITVDGKPLNSNTNNVRIYINNKDDVKIHGKESVQMDEPEYPTEENIEVPLEGDFGNEREEDTIARIQERFDVLDEMVTAAADGVIRSIIVEGSPGAGKSYTVENTLHMCKAFKGGDEHTFIRGNISPIGLYKKLYDYREDGQVIVFDDCDSVFFEPVSLAILKAALDTSPRRVISWNTNSLDLENNGVPKSFEFRGSVIFITNMDFEATKSKQLKPHFDALISRSHYLNLTIKTRRDKFLRIKSLIKNGTMREDLGLNEEKCDQILDFMKENIGNLRELSLRTTVKIADIVKMKPNEWRRICKVTVCK